MVNGKTRGSLRMYQAKHTREIGGQKRSFRSSGRSILCRKVVPKDFHFAEHLDVTLLSTEHKDFFSQYSNYDQRIVCRTLLWVRSDGRLI
jgi:hypothetical protein